jgi:glycosyltransferase involved in cell wall biosynthesis
MSVLRVVHVIPSLAEVSSGPSYSVLRLCESLRDLGVQVTLASLDSPGHRQVPDWVRRFERSIGPARLGRSRAMASWLDEEASAGRVDLIHNHSLWMMPNVYPGDVARRRAVPYLVSPRGTLSAAAFASGSLAKRLMWPLFQRPSLQTTSCFVATSLAEALDIRRAGYEVPIASIPNGIDIPEMLRPRRQRRTLLYLGRIHPIKQVDVLVQVWARIAHTMPDWDLRIVGPDNNGHLDQLQRLANRLGTRRLTFEGELRGERKLEAYREADLYVLPTKTENFGVTVAEALAAGTPVIVTTGAPWRDLGSRGAGWWIPQGADALEQALRTAMVMARVDLEIMGQRGHKWMAECFSWKGAAAQMFELYRWILSGSPIATRPACVVDRLAEPLEDKS